VARQPVGRQRAPATAVEGDQIGAGLPRSDHRQRIGGAAAAGDRHGQAAADVDLDRQRHRAGHVGGGGVGPQPARHLGLQLEGVAAAGLDPPPGQEVELAAQAVAQALLAVEIADRDLAAQVGQAIAVDAGHRRIAVDDHRHHRQRLAALDHVEGDPGRDAARDRGQASGPDLDRDAGGQRRHHRGRDRAQLAGAEPLLGRQVLELGAAQIDRADRPQRVAEPGHAEADRAGPGRRLEPHGDAVAGVEQDRPRHDRLAAGRDPIAGEPDVGGVGQRGQQPIEPVGADRRGRPGAEELIDREVPRLDRQARPAAGRARRHRGRDRRLAALLDRDPGHRQAGRVGGQAVADRGPGDLGLRQRRAPDLGVGGGDRGRAHVRARGLAAAAVAVPLVVREVQHHGERGRPRRHPHLGGDLVGALGPRRHPVLAGQGHALRPRSRRRGFPHRISQSGRGHAASYRVAAIRATAPTAESRASVPP
jgi:hypothetical protein